MVNVINKGYAQSALHLDNTGHLRENQRKLPLVLKLSVSF